MSLALGIDVGTTFTAAAIWRDERVEVTALETHRVTVPTVVFADGDDVQFGTAAATRGASQPSGMAREFKRRLGDPVPIMLSGAPYAADRLVATFARWVLDSVAEQLGEVPDRVVVTHPANWTEFQLHLLTNALEQVGLGDVGMLTEPQAAAIDFGAAAHLDAGDLVVVYDLGGGTFDVSLLRREPVGFTHVGEPAGVERLGGIDFDEAVFQHVLTNVPEGVVAQARSDQAGRMALAQLRRSCVEAKESLSSEVAVDVPVVLPGVTSTVRLTRAEFEEMIRPMLDQTVDLVQRVVSQAGVGAADLAAVLLVGGSSRIPVVSELVRERLGAPVRVDAHPKLVVARGAARWAGTITAASPPRPPKAAASPGRRRGVLVAAGVVALVAVGGGAWFALAGGGDEPSTTGTTGEPATSGPPDSSVTTAPSTDGPETSTQPTSAATATVPILPAGETVVAIEPIGVDELPDGLAVDGQSFAAPTALSADPETGQLLAVSDTDSTEVEAALFSVAVDLSDGTLGEGDVTVESAATLLDAEGQPYSSDLDVEAITATDDGRILIASEGSASGRDPFIHEIDRDGRFVDEWAVPDWYLPDPDGPSGIRPEGGLNSLTAAGADSAQVLAGVEYTLYQDETSPEPDEGEKWARILAYDTASGEAVAEYAYPLDATAPNPEGITSGLLDLVALGDGGTLIALERSRREEPSQIRLYEVTLDASGAPPSPEGPPTLLTKRELTALDPQIPGNWQSMALGPPLPDGRTSLLVLADTNNNPGQPKTVLAFALETQAPS